jgi:two-component system cell cycle sensor histidine kinase/response regulator CckA
MDKRRAVEEQLLHAQKMEAIGQLAGGVAHDFNNLLTAILGYNEMLREEVRGNEIATSYAEEVLHAAERATGLTRQLLAFSRRQIAQPRVLDLNQTISQLDRMFRRIIGEDVVFETRLAPNLWSVRADPSHIDQVILNLVVNSRDAMPRGGTLIVETANVELSESFAERHIEVRSGRYTMLAVSDTGHGAWPVDCVRHRQTKRG